MFNVYFAAMIHYKFFQALGSATNNQVHVFADGKGAGKYCNGNTIDQLKNLAFPSGSWITTSLSLHTTKMAWKLTIGVFSWT
jgi:hypothetical protein